jgi:TPR repeat protein
VAAGRCDYATELRLLRALAGRGKAYAQAKLGLLYEEGRGIPRNFAGMALTWRARAAAAKSGHLACLRLGGC